MIFGFYTWPEWTSKHANALRATQTHRDPIRRLCGHHVNATLRTAQLLCMRYNNREQCHWIKERIPMSKEQSNNIASYRMHRCLIICICFWHHFFLSSFHRIMSALLLLASPSFTPFHKRWITFHSIEFGAFWYVPYLLSVPSQLDQSILKWLPIALNNVMPSKLSQFRPITRSIDE